MAIALTAWLMAPAPMACTSTRPLLRMTPAMAPATATGLEVAETFSTSTGARSVVIAGTPSNVFTVDSLDRCCSASRSINGNQYRIECHGSRGDLEAGRYRGQEALHDRVLVHANAAVPRPDHPDVGHKGCPPRQDASVGGRNMGVGAHDGAGSAVQVPPHRALFRRGLCVHVAKHDLGLRMLGEHGIGRPKRVVEPFCGEDPPHQVHDQDLAATGR